MRIEKIVGQNVARARVRAGWSQPEFGKMIGTLPGIKQWSRQTVSNAESGQRAFTAADLVVLACVLETSPAALLSLRSANEIPTVEIGEASIPREQLENPTWSHESTSQALADVLHVVRTLSDGLDELANVAQPLQEMSGELSAAGHTLEARIRLEEAGAAKPGDYGYV